MSEWARRHGITLVGGSIAERREGREKLSNTSRRLRSRTAQLVAVYRKIHLFDVEVGGVVYRESEAEEPGDEPVVAEAEDWRIGLTVCYDVRFPELYRILALEGAELVTVPAHFTTPTGKDHWHVLLRARAIENQLYVAAAAQIGETLPGKPAYGRSLIVDPWGIVARAGAGRGDRDLRRARPRAPAEHSREAAVAREQAGERVPVADAGLTHGVWLERVPELLDECVDGVGPGARRAVRALGAAGYAVPCRLPDGTRAVLKLIYPHREAEHEAEALALWDGDGAVRLLAHDDERWAMLLERCEPGTHAG